MVYVAREIRMVITISNSPYNWSIVTSKDTLILFLYYAQNSVHCPFSQVFTFLSNMSQSSWKYKAKEVKKLEGKYGKKARALESKKKETEVETHVRLLVGASMAGKKYVTKMKSLKKKHVHTHDFDSDVDEDCVTFIE